MRSLALFAAFSQAAPVAFASAIALAGFLASRRIWTSEECVETPRWGARDVLLGVIVWLASSVAAGALFLALHDSGVLGPVAANSLALLASTLVTVSFVLFVVRRQHGHSLRALGWFPRGPRNVGPAIGALLLAYLPLSLVSVVWMALLAWGGSEAPPQDPVRMFREALSTDDKAMLVFLGGSAVLLAPFWEEMFFRGFLQGWLRRHLSPLVAISLSAALFALVHGLSVFLPIFGVGLLLGWTYERSRNLLDSMVFHAVFNLSQLVLLAYQASPGRH